MKARRRKVYAGGGILEIPNSYQTISKLPSTASLAGAIPGTTGTGAAAGTGFSMGSLDSIVPYVSNIANSFRRVPLPHTPVYTSTITPQQVSYAAQRAAALRKMRGENLGLDESLDENTAAAVKAANLGSEIEAENSINQQEANTNAQLRAEADRINAGIRQSNNALTNAYHQQLTGARIAQQRASSENLANAADKYVAEQDERRKADLDLAKLKVYSQVWKNSGVYDRVMKALEKEGDDNPTGIEYANGGGLSRKSDYGSSSHPYPGVSSGDFAGPHRSYPIPTRADAVDAARLARLHHKPGVLARIHAKYPNVKAAGGPVGPGDGTMSDQQLYSNYLSQLQAQGNKDAPRIASVLTVAQKYGVSPASVLTRTDYSYDGTTPRQRVFTIQEKGKPTRTLVQPLGGASAGSRNSVPYSSQPVASFAAGGSTGPGPKKNYDPTAAATFARRHPIAAVPIGIASTIPYMGDQLINGIRGILKGDPGIPDRLEPTLRSRTSYMDLGRYMINRHLAGVAPNEVYDYIISQLTPEERKNLPEFAAGGSIHIKPSHKGRFKAYLARTGKTMEEALHSKNAHVREMANFARNAKHFHH